MASSYKLVLIIITLAIVFLSSCSSAQLSQNHYDKTCPKLFDIVKDVVKEAIRKEQRMGASLLRLHFHDCFINGCDGSVLLDDTSSVKGEKGARANNNSIRGFNVIDNIKYAVEAKCPGVVSCADILAIAARDSVFALGGPYWNMTVGRLDSKKPNFTAANTGVIPAPTFNFTNLTTNFQNHNLTLKDLIALSGAHTVGQARCTSFRSRIYNETDINKSLAEERQKKCSNSSKDDNNLAPLDLMTPTKFDNGYYRDLMLNDSLLHSDKQLYRVGNDKADKLVISFGNNESYFFDEFVKSMIKMSKLGVLTGSQGEIRKDCRKVNP